MYQIFYVITVIICKEFLIFTCYLNKDPKYIMAKLLIHLLMDILENSLQLGEDENAQQLSSEFMKCTYSCMTFPRMMLDIGSLSFSISPIQIMKSLYRYVYATF